MDQADQHDRCQVFHRDKVIEALSAEILKYEELIMSFRVRIAFVSWVGPFIVLGSFIVAREGKLPSTIPSTAVLACAGLAITCSYIGIGIIAAVIESQARKQCNRLRSILVRLAAHTNPRSALEDYTDPITRGPRIYVVYALAYFFIILSAIMVTWLAWIASSQPAWPY